MDLGSPRDDLQSRGTVTAAKAVFVSSEHELINLESQLVLLLVPAAPEILAPDFLTSPDEPEEIAPLPINVCMPTLDGAATAGEGTGVVGAGRGDGAALRGAGGTVAALPVAPAGRPELRDLEVTMSLQGSHLVACRNGRRAAGLNPADIDGDAEREQAPTMPPVEPIPDTITDSSPTASDAGGSLTGAFPEDGDSISEWLPPEAGAGRAVGLGLGWL